MSDCRKAARDMRAYLKIIIVEDDLIMIGIYAMAGARDVGPQVRLLQLRGNVPECSMSYSQSSEGSTPAPTAIPRPSEF
jgi:hypothetical protein